MLVMEIGSEQQTFSGGLWVKHTECFYQTNSDALERMSKYIA